MPKYNLSGAKMGFNKEDNQEKGWLFYLFNVITCRYLRFGD